MIIRICVCITFAEERRFVRELELPFAPRKGDTLRLCVGREAVPFLITSDALWNEPAESLDLEAELSGGSFKAEYFGLSDAFAKDSRWNLTSTREWIYRFAPSGVASVAEPSERKPKKFRRFIYTSELTAEDWDIVLEHAWNHKQKRVLTLLKERNNEPISKDELRELGIMPAGEETINKEFKDSGRKFCLRHPLGKMYGKLQLLKIIGEDPKYS